MREKDGGIAGAASKRSSTAPNVPSSLVPYPADEKRLKRAAKIFMTEVAAPLHNVFFCDARVWSSTMHVSTVVDGSMFAKAKLPRGRHADGTY